MPVRDTGCGIWHLGSGIIVISESRGAESGVNNFPVHLRIKEKVVILHSVL